MQPAVLSFKTLGFVSSSRDKFTPEKKANKKTCPKSETGQIQPS